MAALKTAIIGSVVEKKGRPVARIAAQPTFGVIGSVIRLDAGESSDPDGTDLTFRWSFVDPPPIGSRVVSEDFRALDESGSVVSFSPDVVGEYQVQLVVSNGVFDSDPAIATVSIRALLVPHGRGIVPDGKFIWGYLRDVWAEVENKEWFETLWSALIQIAGSEMLKLYQTDFNKSIRDIQDRYQRRWLKYEPKLPLEGGFTFYLGQHCAGVTATTTPLETYAVILSADEIAVVQGTVYPSVLGERLSIRTSLDSDNIKSYELSGLNSKKNGYRLKPGSVVPNPTADVVYGTATSFYFDFQSKQWSIDASPGSDLALKLSTQQTLVDTLADIPPMGAPTLADLRGGDVIYYPSGPNAGFYRVVEKSGAYIVVDRAPPSYSDVTLSATYKAYVYRPVQITVSQTDVLLGNSFSVPYETGDNDVSLVAPGRVVVVGGQTFTVSRCIIDTRQRVPITVVTVDEAKVPTGISGLEWRAPSTLVSDTHDFGALGVSPGDVLVWDVLREGTGLVGEFRTYVVGVDGNRLGFVATTDDLEAGVVPSSPPDLALFSLASDLQIAGAEFDNENSLILSDDASELMDEMRSKAFQRVYWNVALTSDSDIVVGGVTFRLRPRYVLRNSRVPVDDTVVSIPSLQEYIVEPSVTERDGQKYLVVRGREYPIERSPVAIVENADFVVDGQVAFHGEMNFRPGSRDVFADGADFVDRGIGPGDTFEIESPSVLAGKYIVQAVVGRHMLRLTRPIPTYFKEWVTARVKLTRTASGNFIRFAPGVFKPSNPAPARLWAEVTFFDNGPSIEANFGILVGLKREDLEDITTNLSYRQAVAGLMYAYTRGPELDRVRLGAQILLGLPFAEHRGIVRSIEPVYRLDLDGNPKLGRILVEDIDKEDVALGTMRAYTFPIDEDSALAGIDTNPETELAYAVGDTVEMFAPLCKGVEVVDYLIEALNSGNAIQILQQFHSLKVRVNDNLFGFEEIQLVSDFLKKITPSYVSVFLASLTEAADDVAIDDEVVGVVSTGEAVIVDDASFNIPTPLISGARTLAGLRLIRTDKGPMVVRREGRDLETTLGSSDVSSAAGGFLSAKAHESYDGPICRAGDQLLILGGDNAGLYPVSGVGSDGVATVTGATFSDAEGQRFAILRPLSALLKSGTADVQAGSPVVTLDAGVRADLVAPGDWLVIGTKRYSICRVGAAPELTDPLGVYGTTPELLDNQVLVTPTPPSTLTASYRVYRPVFLGNPHDETFSVTRHGSNPNVAIVPATLEALLEAGDELQEQGDTKKRYLVIGPRDPVTVLPALPSAGPFDMKLCKPGKVSGPLPLGPRRLDPEDVVELTWSIPGTTMDCTSASTDLTLNPGIATPGMTLDEFVRPGDLLSLGGTGNGAVDVGYGVGVYPVVGVSGDILTLSHALTVTESVGWMIQRMRSL